MIMRLLSYIVCVLALFACAKTPKEKPLSLWYDRPAENWNEALPIGNGLQEQWCSEE